MSYGQFLYDQSLRLSSPDPRADDHCDYCIENCVDDCICDEAPEFEDYSCKCYQTYCVC